VAAQDVLGMAVALEAVIEVRSVGLRLDHRQEGRDRLLRVADQAEVEPAATAQVVRADVELRDLRILRVPVAVREVGAEHQEHVAMLDRMRGRRQAQQPGQADRVRVLAIHHALAAQRVDDGRLQRLGQLHQFGPRVGRSRCRRRASRACRR
jgi:hypothetical protein